LDSGAYFYDAYECSDGEWISIAPIESRFHAELIKLLGIDAAELGEQRDSSHWPRARAVLAAKFKTRTRAEWCERLEGSDACFAPVLSLAEAPQHPQVKARGTFVEVDGVVQPGPAPRFSRTEPAAPTPPQPPDARAALADWISANEIDALIAAGTVTAGRHAQGAAGNAR
jgi:crotonobetainyl-CoA:carnitine CoA-transferase CaiB-like acyl-CoA transferase